MPIQWAADSVNNAREELCSLVLYWGFEPVSHFMQKDGLYRTAMVMAVKCVVLLLLTDHHRLWWNISLRIVIVSMMFAFFFCTRFN